MNIAGWLKNTSVPPPQAPQDNRQRPYKHPRPILIGLITPIIIDQPKAKQRLA
jgi:hypothetical protein